MAELEAARGIAENEVAQLTRRMNDGDGERKDLELRLNSAAQELATTVQLSELALAARVSAAEDERQEKERRLEAEKTRLAEELVGRVVLLVLSTIVSVDDVHAWFCVFFLVRAGFLRLLAVGCTIFGPHRP